MPDPQNIYVRSVIDGATAQLRVVEKVLIQQVDDREEARRLHAELNRISSKLAERYDFTRRERER